MASVCILVFLQHHAESARSFWKALLETRLSRQLYCQPDPLSLLKFYMNNSSTGFFCHAGAYHGFHMQITPSCHLASRRLPEPYSWCKCAPALQLLGGDDALSHLRHPVLDGAYNSNCRALNYCSCIIQPWLSCAEASMPCVAGRPTPRPRTMTTRSQWRWLSSMSKQMSLLC